MLCDTQHLVFGELGNALKAVVDQFQSNEATAVAISGGRSRLNTIGDMQRFMDNYPEFKKQQGVVATHVALTSKLSAVVDARNLLDLSELEQVQGWGMGVRTGAGLGVLGLVQGWGLGVWCCAGLGVGSWGFAVGS